MKHTRTDGKTVRTALDDLPYGPDDAQIAMGPVQKAVVPEGVSRKRLLRDVTLIAMPSFIELVLSQLTSMADQIMVGQMPGEAGVMGLTAVGLATLPRFLLMTLVMAMNVGTTAIIARCRGQQNRSKANQVFRQAILLNLIMSAAMMLLGLAGARWMITFMGGSGIAEATLRQSIEYFNIQMYGFVPVCLSMTITAALRGVGDTTTPMIYNTIANVVNVFMNYVMIYGHFGCPAMGVAGASWATIIGQTVAFCIAMGVAISKSRYVSLDFREKFTFNMPIMRSVASIGLPSMVEQLFMRLGIMIFLRAVASLGDTTYATHQIISNIQSMSFMVGQAFGNASTTLMGQSLGKRRYDMAAVYMKNTRLVGLMISLALMALMCLLNEELIALYNSTPDVIATGAGIMMLLGIVQPIQCDQFILSGGLRGVGDTKYTAAVVFVTTLVVRAILCVVAVYVLGWGLWGAWISIAVDQLMRTVLINLRYKSGKWKWQLQKRSAMEEGKA